MAAGSRSQADSELLADQALECPVKPALLGLPVILNLAGNPTRKHLLFTQLGF
jgi:hypothetical protein